MKRALLALAALVLLAVAATAAFVLYRKHQSRNIRGSPTVEFTTTHETVPKVAVPAEVKEVPWPMYGFDQARLRAPVGLRLRPPFRKLWTAGGSSLLEFPPAIGYGRLYLAANSGLLLAISTRTGEHAWKFQSNRCVAASPALHEHVLFMAFLNKPPCNSTDTSQSGEVVALAVGLGKPRWTRTIGPSETSPLVADGLVYVGDWRGDVYALDERTGATRWRFHTGGPVKGAAALSGGRLFVGSYDGHVYALDARTGTLLWKASAQPRLGASANFYSTPAVAYDRVYIGGTDGKVYSFGATSGKLRWSHGTGGYVYGSPAVWRERVYAGSYDHGFYAFDAATGDVLWRFSANGPISGSATVIDGVVYFATLQGRTYGLDARTGRQLWAFPDGKYSPVVADRRRLYLVGYARLYGMVPVKSPAG